jgi:hypothetical protein
MSSAKKVIFCRLVQSPILVECILYWPDISFCALYPFLARYIILRTVSYSIQKTSYSARLILFYPVIPFSWWWYILQGRCPILLTVSYSVPFPMPFTVPYPAQLSFCALWIVSFPDAQFLALYPILSRCPILFIIFYSGQVSHSVHCILSCMLSSCTLWIIFCLFVPFCSILTYSVRLHRSTKFLLFCPIVLFCPLSPFCPVVPFYSLYPIPPSCPNRLNMPCPAQLSYSNQLSPFLPDARWYLPCTEGLLIWRREKIEIALRKHFKIDERVEVILSAFSILWAF